jgi:hypothetical protein
MNFLEKLRQKPLPARRRLVWIATLVSVAIIVVAWLVFFQEWNIPNIEFTEPQGFQEVVDTSKESIGDIQDQIAQFQQESETATQEAEVELRLDALTTTSTKHDVEVGLVNWQHSEKEGVVSVHLHNLADQTVTFHDFILRQGYEEISSPLQLTLEPQQEKDLDIQFTLPISETVNALEIRTVYFDSADSWNYLFLLRDTSAETTPTANTIQP